VKTLITGITGMIGSHIAAATRSRGWETWGLARSSATSRLAADPDRSVLRCDILDREALEEQFRAIRPELVVHMAAQAFNGVSWQAEETTHQTNYQGTVNVLRAARRFAAPGARVLLACSSAAYGNVDPAQCPLVEERLLRPVSPYGVSKAATEALGYQYFANYGMPVYLPRLFIHVGTGHPPATAIQNFARQLALIAAGRAEPVLRVGNLESARDFIDVRDGVAGMMLLVERGEPGVPVNVCTGTSFRIGEILEMLIDISGLSVEVVPDPALLRPSDEPLLLGDNRRLRDLGWRQEYDMRQTLTAVYRDWQQRL
jgi:GDP-4-dehydro-6-deoxy-D-mannose reductase